MALPPDKEMRLIYKVVVKKKKNTILSIFVLIIVFLLCLAILEYLPVKSYRWALELGAVVLISAAAYLIIHRSLVEYSYCLIDDQLVVNQKIGSRQRTLCEVDLKSIESFKPVKPREAELYKDIKFDGKFYAGKIGDADTWEIVYNAGKCRHRFYFKPGSVMVDIINKRLCAK